MKIRELGEFGFISQLAKQFGSLVPPGYMGIGDDCAIIPAGQSSDWVVTTDLLVENVHFLMNRISPRELGHKSLAVNLSDIAAMGAKPVGSFLSIGFPSHTELSVAEGIMAGYRELSVQTATPLLGGDTTSSPDGIVINVMVIGQCEKGAAKLRSTALPGDLICVTGYLGDSAGGLRVLLEKLSPSEVNSALVTSHHNPKPHLEEGHFLSSCKGVHAMMDISDGIASDLLHMLKASQVSAEIELSSLPVSEKLREAALLNGWDCTALATSGGEDYVLLCTIDPIRYTEISEKFQHLFSTPLYSIGRIGNPVAEDSQPLLIWKEAGIPVTVPGGFTHFAQ